MKIKTGETYIYRGKKVRVIADEDSKSCLVTTDGVFSVQKKELKEVICQK